MPALTPREIAIKNQLYNQYRAKKKEFIKDYGADAEKVMIGRAIKMAKSMAKKQDNTRIKEAIKKALMKPIAEEINSAEYVETRKKENPEDVIKMDVPLLIRMLEYAREDAKTDMDLHFVAENLIELSKTGKILTMDDYNSIMSPNEPK